MLFYKSNQQVKKNPSARNTNDKGKCSDTCTGNVNLFFSPTTSFTLAFI